MTNRFARPAADNNVQDVITVIDGYTCGPVRALAQDPPQNAADARVGGQTVHVRYELHRREGPSGEPIDLLTITDTGTSGLDGPTVTQAQLQERERTQGSLVIEEGENWAAWEAMRYTKSGQDKLGSRGQGKAAYLYHSAHRAPGTSPDTPLHAQRMVVLYDTLLPSGEYRLGVRYHNPSTKIIEPPYLGDEARAIISSAYVNDEDGFHIPLGLEPLTQQGTRVIIPYFSGEGHEAFGSGEFVRWLTAEWWRKIQKGELSIDVVDTAAGTAQDIGIPSYWNGAPWDTGQEGYFLREHIDLPSNSASRRRRVKRVVLYEDDTLANDDVDGMAQLNGVQLLRGGQWITTLDMNQFGDFVPRDHRDGFRGFIEFDRSLEGELREIENPAHDGFNGRTALYQEVVRTIKEFVREYAGMRGWFDEEESADADERVRDLLKELAELFVAPASGGGVTGNQIEWRCTVTPNFPGSVAVVKRGDEVGIRATCTRIPREDGPDVEFGAELVNPDGVRTPTLGMRHQNLRGREGIDSSSAGVNFGQLQVDHAEFSKAGRYVIVVTCRVDGVEVCTGRCQFYVESSPPPPPERSVTLQLVAENEADGRLSIDFGEQLATRVTARNYGANDVDAEIVVTIEGEPYVLQRVSVLLAGVLSGALPSEETTERIIRKVVETGATGSEIQLSAGRHTVLASIESAGVVLANSSAVILIGPDTDSAGDLPFELREIPGDPTSPRWRLSDPGVIDPSYILRWSAEDPVFKAVSQIRRIPPGSDRLPVEDFHSQNIVEALVEWAAREFQRSGDEGRLRLVGNSMANAAPGLAAKFEDQIGELRAAVSSSSADPYEYGVLQRSLAALMLEVAKELRD